MQQVGVSRDETSSELAHAALVYLNSPTGLPESQVPSFEHNVAPILRHSPKEAASVHTIHNTHGGPTGASGRRITAEIESSSAPLPSLLQYVDHVLVRDKHRHNYPPHAAEKCICCNIHWDKARVPSTFLPLWPCDHWIHYRCFIKLAVCGAGSRRGSCYSCNTPLYEWDGINTLTLATRTNLPMKDDHVTAICPSTYALVISDLDEYEKECKFIELTIERRFSQQITKPSGLSDHSPDLVQCYDAALSDLRLMGRPTSKWLMWSTTTGSLLFGMLVAIKMQRFLTEGHGRIKRTEAWVAWEEGCRALQARILEEVHRE